MFRYLNNSGNFDVFHPTVVGVKFGVQGRHLHAKFHPSGAGVRTPK